MERSTVDSSDVSTGFSPIRLNGPTIWLERNTDDGLPAVLRVRRADGDASVDTKHGRHGSASVLCQSNDDTNRDDPCSDDGSESGNVFTRTSRLGNKQLCHAAGDGKSDDDERVLHRMGAEPADDARHNRYESNGGRGHYGRSRSGRTVNSVSSGDSELVPGKRAGDTRVDFPTSSDVDVAKLSKRRSMI